MEPLLWSVKYMPKSWDGFVGQGEAVERLKEFAQDRICPNLLLVGPYGTGKTSAALIFARELLGDSYSSNYLYLNVRDLREYPISKAKRSIQALSKLDRTQRSSFDEYMSHIYQEAKQTMKSRGISGDPSRSKLLQEAIHVFASTITLSGEVFKILVLDEADALTTDMQQALRRAMEIYSSACRFIFITPTLAGWVPAIISRCVVLRFASADIESTKQMLSRIAKQEGVTAEERAITAIAQESEGDYRRATNLLQVAAAASSNVTEDVVYKVYETKLMKGVRKIVTHAIDGSFIKARKGIRYMLAIDGYSPQEIILQLKREIVKRPFDDETQLEILDRLAEIDFRVTQAKNPHIQIEAFIASLIRIASEQS